MIAAGLNGDAALRLFHRVSGNLEIDAQGFTKPLLCNVSYAGYGLLRTIIFRTDSAEWYSESSPSPGVAAGLRSCGQMAIDDTTCQPINTPMYSVIKRLGGAFIGFRDLIDQKDEVDQ
jgi:hypothetical protein